MLSMTAPTHFNRAALPPGIAGPYGPGVLGGPDALICTLLCKVAPIQSNYPMLANVAKIALCCPGSQIECERVFSLCGLTVSLLRNRMTTDNLAQIVYLTKNTKQLAAMQHILSKTHGSINTEHWLGQMENNAYMNAPMPETCVPDPDTLDLPDSNEVPPEEGTEDECVFETPHDWEEVVGDPVADDDDGSLPF